MKFKTLFPNGNIGKKRVKKIALLYQKSHIFIYCIHWCPKIFPTHIRFCSLDLTVSLVKNWDRLLLVWHSQSNKIHHFGIFESHIVKKLSCNINGSFLILIEHLLVDVLWRYIAKMKTLCYMHFIVTNEEKAKNEYFHVNLKLLFIGEGKISIST